MKEMIALEKIVEAKENMNIGYIEWANDCIDEAINELEEAMKPKTCNECEWWDFNSYGIFKKCFNGKGNCVSTESSFGCNRFKQKNNA